MKYLFRTDKIVMNVSPKIHTVDAKGKKISFADKTKTTYQEIAKTDGYKDSRWGWETDQAIGYTIFCTLLDETPKLHRLRLRKPQV